MTGRILIVIVSTAFLAIEGWQSVTIRELEKFRVDTTARMEVLRDIRETLFQNAVKIDKIRERQIEIGTTLDELVRKSQLLNRSTKPTQ